MEVNQIEPSDCYHPARRPGCCRAHDFLCSAKLSLFGFDQDHFDQDEDITITGNPLIIDCLDVTVPIIIGAESDQARMGPELRQAGLLSAAVPRASAAAH